MTKKEKKKKGPEKTYRDQKLTKKKKKKNLPESTQSCLLLSRV